MPRTDVVPWSAQELADLACVGPHDRAGMKAFLKQHPRRTARATSARLLLLRTKGGARDATYRKLDRSLLTDRGRSL